MLPKRTHEYMLQAAAVPFRGWVEVEVLDAASGQPEKQYGKEQCVKIVTDNTNEAKWQGIGGTWKGVSASAVRIRFYLYGRAKLHSFSF